MRMIGLLGGMSWESSAEYYRIVNEEVRDRLGGLHSARVLLHSVDFAGIEALQTAGDWATAARVLLDAGRSLRAGGAELLVLCTNTMHKVAGELERGLDIPLLHLADTTAVAVKAAGTRRVGLLGTAFTMEQAFYRDKLAGHGLDVLVPGEADRGLVHRVIYDELVVGLLSDESRQALRQVIGRLVAAGARGVILGCTELELLVGPADSPVPLFPTTRLHAEAAVTAALDQPSS
jgi:aspartate racemase